MPGPKIIETAPEPPRQRRTERQTGVRPEADGSWTAIRNGRFVGTFRGTRGFLAASRAAGSTERLS